MTFKEKIYVWSFSATVVLLQSCQASCVDSVVERHFNHQFSIIERQLTYSTAIAGEPMYAIITLKEITGIASSIQFGDVSLYKSYSDYELDKKRWTDWLHSEGCNLSAAELNDVLKKVEAKNGYLID